MWDFGGQEVYHATHQFFLTKRSLYILVDDTRKDSKSVDDVTFKYWLEICRLFGGDSPLLIVQNEKGGRSKDINLSSMQARFKFIKGKYASDLKDCRGLAEVRNAIEYHIQKLPHVGQELPKRWIEIREALLALSKTKAYIPFDEYRKICANHSIPERERALNLSSYLHDLGTFLHFQDDALLKKTIVLNNEWVTDAVYELLDNEVIKDKGGQFTKNEACEIWNDPVYEDMQDELLQLLINFELIYELDNKLGHYSAPQLLPIAEPDHHDWDSTENLEVRYEYGFMPRGLLNRLVVRNHQYLSKEPTIWREGVVFEYKDTFAEVKETYAKNEIQIRVRGAQPKVFMSILIAEIDKLNESFGGIEVDLFVPCNCSECKVASKVHSYKFNSLERRLVKGVEKVNCDSSFEDVSVKALLENVIYGLDEKMSETRGDIYNIHVHGGNIQGLGRIERTQFGQLNEESNPKSNGGRLNNIKNLFKKQ